ncbi:S-adenosyl-L-methionine-dependent methyltransferase [Lasiosphaeria hispida]|uniref:S-adenosyl-L-methionine-dependent methyltransferase n=1 Tax=Lasiosphaeria hispida TaxID=260671 RepID=A0AAJ0HSJ8_9PEZI|nr:S-adenosyl-L-methionine-dependent methyltransferase [Lasiosphaeria hispida]
MATLTKASGNKDQYNEMATEYNGYAGVPMARLEAELIRKALGDLTGLTVLDLGGGSGTHARQAVKAGARQVDVVDISDAMMQIGRDIEAESEEGRIHWHLADVSKPIAEQGIDLPTGQYDIAMANWVFDHALNPDDLRGMWANIATSLKPGGSFVGIRVYAPVVHTEYSTDTEKYGSRFTEIKEIPGGFKCVATLLTSPPFSFGLTPMEDSYTLANEIPKQLGMTDFKTVPDEDTKIVKEDPEFWKDHLQARSFVVMTARKA